MNKKGTPNKLGVRIFYVTHVYDYFVNSSPNVPVELSVSNNKNRIG